MGTKLGKKLFNFFWSLGNSKLKKEKTVTFNLPAYEDETGFSTCPFAALCALLCYARQGRFIMQSVDKPRQRNMQALRAIQLLGLWDEFVAAMVSDIEKLPRWVENIRPHDSGDFFSVEYLAAWYKIAEQIPDMNFYAYTKSLPFVQALENKRPANFQITQSVGGKLDRQIDTSKSFAVVLPSEQDITDNGLVSASKTDAPARQGCQKIGLAYHGNKALDRKVAGALHTISFKILQAA